MECFVARSSVMTAAASAAVAASSCADSRRANLITLLDAILMASIFVALSALSLLGITLLDLLLGRKFRLKDPCPIPA